MGDFFSDNLWEEEPDFAKDDFRQNDGHGEETDALGLFEDNENQYGAQHVIALVDCHPEMFEHWKRIDDENNVTHSAPIDMSMKLIHTLLQQTIEQTVIRKTGKRNGIGIFLYNTKPIRDEIPSEESKDGVAMDNDVDDDDEDDRMDDDDDDDDEEEGSTVQAQNEANVHRLLDLEPPGVRQVKIVGRLVSDDRQCQTRDLKAEFCPTDRDLDFTIPPLQTAIEEAMRMFLAAKCVKDPMKNARGKNEADSKAIWIFTNQTDPYSDHAKQMIENMANLAKEQRIAIIVWPLPQYSSNEEVNTFRSPFLESISSMIVKIDEDEDESDEDDAVDFRPLLFDSEMEEGLAAIYGSMAKKRRTYYTPMRILRSRTSDSGATEKPSIMIDWFALVQLSRRPGKVKIDTETKTETVKVRLTLEKDTGREVARFWTKPTIEQREQQREQPGMKRFRQFFNFVGELIPITQEDMRKIKENANGGHRPGLTILGFKPRDAIPPHHSISKTFVIFPNDTDVQGSSRAFQHLHAAMLRKNVVALGEAHFRETGQSRFVAIFPFEETDRLPSGMTVNILPFEDDMRAIAADAAWAELDRLKQRRIPFVHGDCILPRGTEALQKTEPSNVVSSSPAANLNSNDDFPTGHIASEDLTNAAMQLMKKQPLKSFEIGGDFENAGLIEFFSYLKSVAFDTPKETNVYDTHVNQEMVRKVAGNEIESFLSHLPTDVERANTTSKKRVRKSVPDTSGIDWEQLYRDDEIESCKIPQLKQYLRSVGLSTTGRKSDLVERIIRSLEANPKQMSDTTCAIKAETMQTI